MLPMQTANYSIKTFIVISYNVSGNLKLHATAWEAFDIKIVKYGSP